MKTHYKIMRVPRFNSYYKADIPTLEVQMQRIKNRTRKGELARLISTLESLDDNTEFLDI